MQDGGYDLLRIHLPRTPVNKGYPEERDTEHKRENKPVA
jgi:hypothetical protein